MPTRQKERPQLAPSPPDRDARAVGAAGAQRRMSARGAPAPLTQRDVDALSQGRIDRAVAERIASRPLEAFERSLSGAAPTSVPVKLEAEDLALLRQEGRVSAKFERKVERAASTRDPPSESEAAGARKSAPKLSPGEAGEDNGTA